MNPNPNKIYTSEDNGSSSASPASAGAGTTISPSAPPEGTEGVLPLPMHDEHDKHDKQDAPDSDVETEKPSRAGQIGEGSYEGTDGYAKRIGSYLRTADVEKDAEAAAPHSRREARDMLAAEIEAASHSKAPGK